MIEDKELRELFKIEASEHLQNLDAGLLRLEKEPRDQKILEELFREAHSLKGAARMLGLLDIQNVAHTIEDLLGSAKSGKTIITKEQIDPVYATIDGIKKLVSEALTGAPSGVAVEELKNSLKEGERAESAESEKEAAAPVKQQEETADDESGESKEGQRTVATPSVSNSMEQPGAAVEEIPSAEEIKSYSIDTVRVSTSILDRLLTHVDELSINSMRLFHRLDEIEEAIEQYEEWERLDYQGRITERTSLAGLRLREAGTLQAAAGITEREREAVTDLGKMLSALRDNAYDDVTRLDYITGELQDGIRSISLIPLSTLFRLYPRMMRDMAHEAGKEMNFSFEGEDTSADKHIIEEIKDPIMHLLRNSIDHGIETPEERRALGKDECATIRLRAYREAANIVIEVIDDGRGLDRDEIKKIALRKSICSEEDIERMSDRQIESLIFTRGFSTSTFVTELSGRGVGLDVVSANVDRLKGSVKIESTHGEGATIRMVLPVTVSTLRALISVSGGFSYAIPLEYVETTRFVKVKEIFPMEGRDTVAHNGEPLSVAYLHELLDSAGQRAAADELLPCIVITADDERLGVIVEAITDEQEIVIKPQSSILKRVRNVLGSTILGTGDICTVLRPPDLIKTIKKLRGPVAAVPLDKKKAAEKKRLLLVEDSITTRTQERHILEGAGYKVTVAVDGIDALDKLRREEFDAVVSDITMPNMDGLTLTGKIRADKKYGELPVILVTMLSSDDDRRRGLEVGANAYITKPSFDQRVLLEILERII